MNKKYLALVCLILGGAAIGFCQTPTPLGATADDGRRVVLRSDGTWAFVESTDPALPEYKVRICPTTSTASASGKHGFFQLYYNPETWEPQDSKFSAAEFFFHHVDGDVYAMVISERLAMPLETLKNAALKNARTAGQDLKVKSEETRLVNGQEVLSMQFDCTVQGVPFAYSAYYWSGEPGSVQVLIWTGSNLLMDYREDIEGLLDGLVIKERDEETPE